MAKKKKIATSELASFCEQLYLILKAGISYDEGLSIISKDATNTVIKQVSTELEDLIHGDSLANALEKVKLFPKYMVEMVNIGENTGRLEEVMAGLTDFYQRRYAIERSIKSAVVFPLVMALMMFAVIIVLIVKVLPVFYKVLQSFAGGLSAFSLGLLKIGGLISGNATVIALVLIAVIVLLVVFFLTDKGKKIGEEIIYRMFKKINTAIAIAGFSSSMALMLKSGMNIDHSLEMAKETLKSSEMITKIQHTQDLMDKGLGFAQATNESEVFNNIHNAMIELGVKTGTLEQVMDYIAKESNQKAEEKISNLISLIEPTIVIVFSLIVAIILLSVILPLMGVMTSL
ncbi:MAG: type II secretion system F family protein [Clostridiales bacterium]